MRTRLTHVHRSDVRNVNAILNEPALLKIVPIGMKGKYLDAIATFDEGAGHRAVAAETARAVQALRQDENDLLLN
jgi:hypothetical protein